MAKKQAQSKPKRRSKKVPLPRVKSKFSEGVVLSCVFAALIISLVIMLIVNPDNSNQSDPAAFKEIKTPRLIGLTYDEATIVAKRHDLRLQVIEMRQKPGNKEIVLGQTPIPKEPIETSTAIDIVLSE